MFVYHAQPGNGYTFAMPKLLNHERAMEIMERENLDGLIAQLPINSYYLSSYWG